MQSYFALEFKIVYSQSRTIKIMARHIHSSSRRAKSNLNIPEKANKILNLIFIALVVIILRIWYLAVIQYEVKLEEALKPQRKTVIEPSKRATIRDRFNYPLALNKISYRAAIIYSQLRHIPSIRWEKDAQGNKKKKFKRKEYITQLSQLLGEELHLDPLRLEDLIHAKSSFYGQIPFVIKEDLTEKEYYRLKMLEKDWLGLHVQKVPKRYYPKGRVAADIIGYMGAINRQEYDKIMREIKMLEAYIQGSDAGDEIPLPSGVDNLTQARQRLQDLLDHAYTINDYVGKAGVEGSFENNLRGYHGKKSYYSDSRGNFLRELSGSHEPVAGQRILLTISAELQEYAEQLLIQNERIRETRLSKYPFKPTKQPWIKGGAIVALDPQSGEVLALASYPRTDPNDFIPAANPEAAKKKIANIIRWFESENYIAEVWDQKRPLERELYQEETKEFYEDTLMVDWNNYLKLILKADTPIMQAIQEVDSVQKAVIIQQAIDRLIELSGTCNIYALLKLLYGEDGTHMRKEKIPLPTQLTIENNLKAHADSVEQQKKILAPYFSALFLHYDKILLVDLCRLAVCNDRFSPQLLAVKGQQSLEDYRNSSAAYISLQETAQKMAKELFHEQHFIPWRQENEKLFLKEKRAEEKAHHQYPKPYIDYFDKQEKEMFNLFWNEHQWDLLLVFLTGRLPYHGSAEIRPYLNHFLTWYNELQAGAHAALPWKNAFFNLSFVLKDLDEEMTKDYLRTFRSFHHLDRPLLGYYRYLNKTNGKQIEKDLARAFYPLRGYGYGRSQAYRQAATQGSIFKLITSYEALKQRYQHLNNDKLSPSSINPLIMVDQIFKKGKDTFVGYHQDGTPIPQYYKGGRMLKSHAKNIGKIDLIRAIETSSNPYFSILAAEYLSSPADLSQAALDFSYGTRTGIDLPGEIAGKVPNDLITNRTGLYSMANGQHTLVVTPLQTSIMLSAIANKGHVLKPKIVSLTAGYRSQAQSKQPLEAACLDHSQIVKKAPTLVQRNLFMPDIIRNILLIGMHKVVLKQLSEGLTSLSRFYREYPEAIADYLELKDEMVGKTSTAESMENIDLDFYDGTNLYTHVWFGGIAFNQKIPSDSHALLYLDRWGNPELVVVVYLKYGAWGKESAPLGAQMVRKWREIKARHETHR
ncbi:hypothetical protein DB41_AE00010 [Neochlamydia sp. TUME1]|nr:hypothetical protein DB41_AE00010 [Neochlamydia sp. TUME1]